MTASADPTEPKSSCFFGTVWPKILASDSDSLRRRKLAVRAGHASMAVMVMAGVLACFLAYPADYTLPERFLLSAFCAAYILWNFVGTRGVVTLVLWEEGVPPTQDIRVPKCGVTLYFLVQLTLASAVFVVADRGRIPNLLWLSLLPPVAYAVFLLNWRGIIVIALLAFGVFSASWYRWHGFELVTYAAGPFSFAVLFTIVFAMLAVYSQRSRYQVQQLAAELGEANRRLREYALQAEELSASRERNRIAREIHDSLGHYLTVANVQLQAAQTLAQTDVAGAWKAIANAQSFIQEGLQDVRHSVASLRRSPLDNKSLADALQELSTNSSSVGQAIEFQVRGTARKLSSPAELSLYRAAQEGLTNARKHSQAKQARLTLDYDTGRVAVSVEDDGIGAREDTSTEGFGLLGLRERAQLLGGQLRISTKPNSGYTLNFEIPG